MVIRRQETSTPGVGPASVETMSPHAVAAWKKWAEEAIGGPPGRVRVGFAVARRAAELGHDQEHVVAYAKYAASEWRADKTDEFYVHAVPPPAARSGGIQHSEATEDAQEMWARSGLALVRVIAVEQRIVSEKRRNQSAPKHRLDLQLQPSSSAPSARMLVACMEGTEFVGSLMPGDFLGIDPAERSKGVLTRVRNLTTRAWVTTERALSDKLPTSKDSGLSFQGIALAVGEHVEFSQKSGILRSSVRQTHVLTFRIPRDVQSGLAHFLQVEMLGRDVLTGIAAGDLVEFSAEIAEITGGIARPKSVRNLTTGRDVTWRQ